MKTLSPSFNKAIEACLAHMEPNSCYFRIISEFRDDATDAVIRSAVDSGELPAATH